MVLKQILSQGQMFFLLYSAYCTAFLHLKSIFNTLRLFIELLDYLFHLKSFLVLILTFPIY